MIAAALISVVAMTAAMAHDDVPGHDHANLMTPDQARAEAEAEGKGAVDAAAAAEAAGKARDIAIENDMQYCFSDDVRTQDACENGPANCVWVTKMEGENKDQPVSWCELANPWEPKQ